MNRPRTRQVLPLPVFSPLLARGFELVFDRVTKLLLAGVHVRTAPALASRLPASRPVLLFGNHVSNWDGFFYRNLQKRLRPAAVTYSVMLERETRRLPLFKGLGGIGIEPTSAVSVARALRRTRALRQHEQDFFFTVFPQGSTYPASMRPLGFQEGVRAFAAALAPVTMVPVAMRFEHLGSLRSHAFIHVGEPLAIDLGEHVPPLAALEASVADLLDQVDDTLCREGEAAVHTFERQPFEASVTGRA